MGSTLKQNNVDPELTGPAHLLEDYQYCTKVYSTALRSNLHTTIKITYPIEKGVLAVLSFSAKKSCRKFCKGTTILPPH